ncbi:MAG: hypothetical protein H0W10_08670 [Chloroflexi bacterium]|nr:hypothetical protein [Chloroflexota bacterium]
MTEHTTSTLDQPTTGSSNDQSEAQHPLVDAGMQATESAGHLAERAADIGLQQADRGRKQAASGIDKVAQTIRRVSTEMETEQPGIANAAQTAADQADRVAQYLRETDARQMISNVEEMARRQPLIFLGGAFLLGVAASRFIKAAGGASGQGQGDQGGQYGRSGYSTSYGAGSMSDYENTGSRVRNGNEDF